jgi:hypothetical protein
LIERQLELGGFGQERLRERSRVIEWRFHRPSAFVQMPAWTEAAISAAFLPPAA